MTLVTVDALVQGAISGNYIVSFPTDTVPALAVRPESSALIFEAKQRTSDKPLILMAATAEALWPYVSGTPEERQVWQQVADTYWPGALTLVLPASVKLPPAVNPKDPTSIGIRVPDSVLTRKILEQTGPLATTSANLSGQSPLKTPEEIEAQFPEVLILESTELELAKSASGLPSTVAKWSEGQWVILRQGAITLKS